MRQERKDRQVRIGRKMRRRPSRVLLHHGRQLEVELCYLDCDIMDVAVASLFDVVTKIFIYGGSVYDY